MIATIVKDPEHVRRTVVDGINNASDEVINLTTTCVTNRESP
ncbi:MAG: hypothetical protein U5O16_23320 [Rhodococcus sp. (in: high G+C Gram-positive bacteria)]|nr:hypothetical protein [Rhodococcus sp. (in: high G+C Gram-positive bacteria)]